MKTLEAIQHDFYQAIFQKESTDPEFIASNYPAQRLATYRRTIFDNLHNALALTYPGIWTLLGEDCANSVARAFCSHQINLPPSASLDDWGAQFPDFLSHQSALSNLPYLKDYATYEWLKHLAYCAPTSPSMNANELEAIPEPLIESIQLLFLPSVFTLQSYFPLDKIENIIENPAADKIHLNSNIVYALIARLDNAVHTFWLPADQWLFINSIQQQLPLAQAFHKTNEQHPEFDLTATLQWILKMKIIAEIRVKSSQA